MNKVKYAGSIYFLFGVLFLFGYILLIKIFPSVSVEFDLKTISFAGMMITSAFLVPSIFCFVAGRNLRAGEGWRARYFIGLFFSLLGMPVALIFIFSLIRSSFSYYLRTNLLIGGIYLLFSLSILFALFKDKAWFPFGINKLISFILSFIFIYSISILVFLNAVVGRRVLKHVDCQKRGGEIINGNEYGGTAHFPSLACAFRYSDADKSCTDKKDCEGACILMDLHKQEDWNLYYQRYKASRSGLNVPKLLSVRKVGKCQRYQDELKICLTELKDGKVIDHPCYME